MTSPLAYQNGQFVPAAQLSIPVHDAGFVWGATVTDRARTFNGRPFRLEEHLRRFRKSCTSARVPLIDIGTLAKIRDGAIAVRAGIDRFTADGVAFTDGMIEKFDVVILATGFRPDLRSLIPGVVDVFDQHGMPRVTGKPGAEPGLSV